MKENEAFYRLEIIKERMLSMFYEQTKEAALEVWKEIGDWLSKSRFKILDHWYKIMNKKWDQIAIYFDNRFTTAMSEGINNVIKSLIRRGFGYRNMNYLKLKIMQICGYLNSRFIQSQDQLLALL